MTCVETKRLFLPLALITPVIICVCVCVCVCAHTHVRMHVCVHVCALYSNSVYAHLCSCTQYALKVAFTWVCCVGLTFFIK